MTKILGTHLDALYLSAQFEFPDYLKTLFDAFKLSARESGDDLYEVLDGIVGVPGGAFYMKPTGTGKYQYVLENAAMWVAFSTWANMPAMQLQFKATTLYEYGPEVLGQIVDDFLRTWIGPELIYKIKVTRADVAVDFQKEGFKLPEMPDVITRARERTVNYLGGEANAITLGKRNGAVQAQVYCKSKELEKVDKAWMLDVWEASGVYDKSLAVWRAELRYYREGLHAFGIDSLEELLSSLGDLAGYAVGETAGSWLRFSEPSTRGENTARRHVTDWWVAVRAAFLEGAVVSGRKRKGYNPRPSYNRAVEMAGAYMARAAALSRIGSAKDSMSTELRTLAMNPEQFGKHIGNCYRDHLRHKRLSWADKVNMGTAKLRTVAW